MIHLFLGIIVSTIFSGSVWARCEAKPSIQGDYPNAVKVNLPLINNGKPSCYTLKSGITAVPEEDKVGSYELSPLYPDFVNVAAAKTYHFLNIEYDVNQKPSKVLLSSYLCSGETPIGGDAIALNLSDESTSEEGIFITSGEAATTVNVNLRKKMRSKVFDQFMYHYEQRDMAQGLLENNLGNIYVPNVVSGLSKIALTPMERKMYSLFFSHANSTINGCSKDFIMSMDDLLIDNVVKNQPFNGIEIKKKFLSSKYKLKVTLKEAQ